MSNLASLKVDTVRWDPTRTLGVGGTISLATLGSQTVPDLVDDSTGKSIFWPREPEVTD